MVDYNKKKLVKNDKTPTKSITKEYNPDSFYKQHPSWCFNHCDREKWCFCKETAIDNFWSEILPCMQSFETCTWDEILVKGKYKNHNINLSDLNTCARKRLAELHIEAEAITSLRINNTHRLYGYITNAVFHLLWYDTEHGDNSSCVCRSYKKHT